MSIIKLFPVKDSYISSSLPYNNYGINEILYLSVCSNASAVNNVTRSIVQFDLTSSNYINAITGSYSATLKLYNAKNRFFTDENFNIELYPLIENWSEGSGSQMFPLTGAVSYNLRTPLNGWSTNGGTYTSSPSASINFLKGTENLTANISAFIEYWKNNSNNGLLLKFSSNIETATGVSGSYFNSKSFFAKDTHTLFRPHISIQTNDVLIKDDVNNLHLGNNNFFIYDINVTGTTYSGSASIKSDLYATSSTGYSVNYFSNNTFYITVPFQTYANVTGPLWLVASNTGVGTSITSSITGNEIFFWDKNYTSTIDCTAVLRDEYSVLETPQIQLRVFKYVYRKMGSHIFNCYPLHVYVSFKEKNTFTQVLDYQECNYNIDGYFTFLKTNNLLSGFYYFPSIKIIEQNGNIFIKDLKDSTFFIR